MGSDQSNFLTELRRLHQRSLDLAIVVALSVVGTFVVLSPQTVDSWLRTLFGLPLVLFLPGYALSTALFPAASSASETETPPLAGGIERIVVSVVGSIAVGPILAIGLNYTPWGIHRVSVVVSIGAFAVLAAIVGAYRRQHAAGTIGSVSHWRTFVSRTNLSPFDSSANLVLSVLVVVSLLAAGATAVDSVVSPDRGERYTEFYLLTEDGDQRIAEEYPGDLVSGENRSAVVGIHNREQQTERYSVVVVLQRVDDGGGGVTVVEEQELRRFHTRLAPNESTETRLGFTPELAGERLRLAFFLYRDGVPSNPTPKNAYRDLHLWVTVDEETPETTDRNLSTSAGRS